MACERALRASLDQVKSSGPPVSACGNDIDASIPVPVLARSHVDMRPAVPTALEVNDSHAAASSRGEKGTRAPPPYSVPNLPLSSRFDAALHPLSSDASPSAAPVSVASISAARDPAAAPAARESGMAGAACPSPVVSPRRLDFSAASPHRSYLEALLSPSPSQPKRKKALVFSPSSSGKLCFRCLSPEHPVRECRDPVRCKCGRSGHRSPTCKSPPLRFINIPKSGPSVSEPVSPTSPRLSALVSAGRSRSSSPPAARRSAGVRTHTGPPMFRPPTPFPRGAMPPVSLR
jgi:hypothetical protein